MELLQYIPNRMSTQVGHTHGIASLPIALDRFIWCELIFSRFLTDRR